MIYVTLRVELFETPTSDYSHLGNLTASAGVSERRWRFAKDHKKELMRRNKTKEAAGQLDWGWGINRVLGIKRNGTVKCSAAAQRQKQHSHSGETMGIKEVCAHLTSKTPLSWMVSPFSSCSVHSITYSQCRRILQLSCISAVHEVYHHEKVVMLPPLRVSCELLFILTYQLSDLSILNAICHCSFNGFISMVNTLLMQNFFRIIPFFHPVTTAIPSTPPPPLCNLDTCVITTVVPLSHWRRFSCHWPSEPTFVRAQNGH